jgi:NAD(P)-dependent dehydrogenase (short-subunit alcohol dehydrogenase family)
MATFNLSGKVALVTGAASGFGLATAEAFIEAGASVAMADINSDDASFVIGQAITVDGGFTVK